MAVSVILGMIADLKRLNPMVENSIGMKIHLGTEGNSIRSVLYFS